MGTRIRTYIAIAPTSQPDFNAPVLRALDAEVHSDARGHLVLVDSNLQPLWSRIPDRPGPVPTLDLEQELALFRWLGTVGTDHFRLVRHGDEFDMAGRWTGAAAFLDVAEVRDAEAEVRRVLGHDASLLGPDLTCGRCGSTPDARDETCPDCTDAAGRDRLAAAPARPEAPVEPERAGTASPTDAAALWLPRTPDPEMLQAGAHAACLEYDFHGKPMNPESDRETAAGVWSALVEVVERRGGTTAAA